MWTYTPQRLTCSTFSCQQQVTVIKPSGDSAVYGFTVDVYGAWPTQVDYYTGAVAPGNLVATQTATWNSAKGIRLSETTTLNSGGTNINNTVRYTYEILNDLYPRNVPISSNVTKKEEWNFYTGALPAFPDRVTSKTFTSANPGYIAKNIINVPTSITVSAGSGVQLSQANYIYDSTALSAVTGITHHDDLNFGTGNAIRGNLTQIQRWAGGTSYLNTTKLYDTTGQNIQTQDPRNNTTTFSYSDCFRTDNGVNPPATFTPSAPTNAYLTRTTLPLTGSLNYCYYFGTGKLASSQDQNLATTYTHYLDPWDRATHVYLPDGGWTLSQYTFPTQTDFYKAITATTPSAACSSCIHSQESMDSLGRTIQMDLLSDANGVTHKVTSYDTNGRVQSVANPFRNTPSSTDGSELLSYDGLDRIIQITRADNSIFKKFYGPNVTTGGGTGSQLCSSTTYGLGYPIVFVDEASKKKQTWTDGFGRIIEVDEPDSSGSLTAPTCYQYDLLNNLTGVLQNGSRQRTFTYNSLSQLTSANNPESGTISYTYDNNGNLATKTAPAPNQTGADTVTTKYCYDTLNRLTGKSYTAVVDPCTASAPIRYLYDQTSYNGLTITNGIGRRTGMTDMAGAEAWSYDAMGRVLADRRTTNNVTNNNNTRYTYNLDGSIATLSYPSGRTITYTSSTAGRIVSAVDTANSINYATGALYSPFGALTSLTNSANLVSTLYYNNRFQPCRVSVKSSGTAPSSCADAANIGNILDFRYNFSLTADNGSATAITNNKDTTRSQSFTYDALNRIATAQTAATTGTNCWGETFNYDPWGNLLSIGGIAQYTGCTQEALSVAVTPKNQIVGYCYDAAGNLLAQSAPPCPVPAYTYNTENQLTTTGGVTYTYDGDGKRVQKSNGKLYWYGMGSDPLAESDAAGNITNEYIFFNGKRIARRMPGSGSSPISVQNASFGSSNPLDQACYCGPYNNTGVPGWTSSGAGPFGSWQPNANSYNSPLPGVVALVNVGTFSQTLTGTALQSNATYTLSVDVGHRLEGYVTSYSISLQAGPTVVATISGSNGTIPAGTFQTQTLTYAAGSAPPAGDLTIVLTSGGAQSNFKNVVLTASGSIQYYFSDHLGTARVVTDANGAVRDDSDFYPFGGERIVLSFSGNNYKFTGKERDSESGLDNFGARYDSSNLGRFMSADPGNISGLLYQSDPQSWNGYAYARNNPLAYVDRNGLWPGRIHNEIYEAVFEGVLTRGQIDLIKRASANQDSRRGQDPKNSNWHGQCVPSQSMTQCGQGIANLINTNLAKANAVANVQGLSDSALTYFTIAGHALTDLPSPSHSAPDGTPTTWNGIFGQGSLGHVIGERDESLDWYGIGQSVRNIVAGFVQAFPEDAARLGDPNRASQRAIERIVRDYFNFADLAWNPGGLLLREESARQCALGNRAACPD